MVNYGFDLDRRRETVTLVLGADHFEMDAVEFSAFLDEAYDLVNEAGWLEDGHPMARPVTDLLDDGEVVRANLEDPAGAQLANEADDRQDERWIEERLG